MFMNRERGMMSKLEQIGLKYCKSNLTFYVDLNKELDFKTKQSLVYK